MRIPGQSPEEWSPETEAELNATISVSRDRPIHLPSVIAHHPTFLAPYLEWAKAVALRGVLEPRPTAILALRTTWNCRSDFEWGVHAERASFGAALTSREIAAVAGGAEEKCWSTFDSALIVAADELWSDGRIGDTAWAVLAEEYEAAAMVEVCFVVGHYTMLSMVATSAGVPGEDHWPDLGAAPSD